MQAGLKKGSVVEIVEDVATLRERVLSARCGRRSVGLVPTMGYLHAGHRRLLERARRENDLVIASIYVNPTQFGPNEDLGRYPRDFDRDTAILEGSGTDILFRPSTATMYPGGVDAQSVWIEPGPLASHLCGPSRPGHFRGVATVVAKLFNMVQPDRAYFGQKDAQQSAIVTRMALDLALPVEVVVVETVREDDGLALSSRNAYLSAEERSQAGALFAALQLARRLVQAGERDSAEIVGEMQRLLHSCAPDGRIDYVSIVDANTFQPVERIERDVLVAVAVYLGKARLIDNMMVEVA